LLSLTLHAHARRLVQALRLDQREGNVTVETRVARQVDLLLATLA